MIGLVGCYPHILQQYNRNMHFIYKDKDYRQYLKKQLKMNKPSP